MKKLKSIEYLVCDICGEPSHLKCSICGEDLCDSHSIVIYYNFGVKFMDYTELIIGTNHLDSKASKVTEKFLKEKAKNYIG